MTRAAKYAVDLWQNQLARDGIIIATGGTLYLMAGYAGVFGELFVEEHHDRAAMAILGAGLAFFLFGAIQLRASTARTRAALRQYRFAIIIARIIGTVLLLAAALFAAASAALLLLFTLPPWLLPSRSANLDQLLSLIGAYFFPALLLALLALALTALFELRSRREELASFRWTELPLSILELLPVTLLTGSAFFVVSIAALFALAAFALLATAAAENAPLFPAALQPAISALDQIRTVKTGLPLVLLLILSIFAHYRARSRDPRTSSTFTDSAFFFLFLALGLQFIAFVAFIATLAYQKS